MLFRGVIACLVKYDLSQISSIVEEQLVRWSYRSQKRSLNATKKYPTITISRQYGTCGSQIAKK